MSLKHPITPEPRPQDDFWVLCGYAGWGPGQLQGEIEDRKSWHVAAASVKVFLFSYFREEFSEIRARAFTRVNVSESTLSTQGGGSSVQGLELRSQRQGARHSFFVLQEMLS